MLGLKKQQSLARMILARSIYVCVTLLRKDNRLYYHSTLCQKQIGATYGSLRQMKNLKSSAKRQK